MLEVNGKRSEEADYGDPLELKAGGNHYIAFLDVDKDGEPISTLGAVVYRVQAEVEPELVGGEGRGSIEDGDEDGDETVEAKEVSGDSDVVPEEVITATYDESEPGPHGSD